jgi:hypothetical protein
MILGRRSAVVSVLYWGLVLTGLVIFLAALIIGLVYVGQKDPIHAHFLYWWLLTFHYVAWGATLPMLFGTVTLKKGGGFLNQSIVLAILYLLALIFDILCGIFYGILGFEACQGKNQDQVEAGICDNQQWVVWVLWIIVILLIIHAAVGIVGALLDRFMRRSPAGQDASQGEATVPDVEDLGDMEARFNTNNNYTYSSHSMPATSTVVYGSNPPMTASHRPAALASRQHPHGTFAYVKQN